jgi:hypothetical protein
VVFSPSFLSFSFEVGSTRERIPTVVAFAATPSSFAQTVLPSTQHLRIYFYSTQMQREAERSFYRDVS